MPRLLIFRVDDFVPLKQDILEGYFDELLL